MHEDELGEPAGENGRQDPGPLRGGGGWTCGEMPQSGLCGEMADDSTDWERVSKENIV